ncbi:MAG: branched-chain amino acid aminotransferase [Desulfococcus multivorans]|jgi:branched-chain amino acid aminotransferase|nr:branched-chain amino acid aminotransferase [Desulfococcus multivorans]
MELIIKKAEALKPLPKDADLTFGTLFSDHMFNMDYDPENGWHNPRIEPFQPLVMSPATMVLHYGQSIFEGLKAFQTADGKIQLFRPEANFQRFNRSGHKLCMPPIDEEFALHALKELLKLDRRWVPSTPGTSLYIRPTIIAMDPYIGVRASHTYRFFIILSPVGAYYKEGFNPVKIWVTDKHVRAVRGGMGEVKTAGNYAASLYAGEEAHRMGYTQVLWLDGVELKYIEEVGSMNIFFVIDGEVVTPALSGSILSGITRDTVIRLAKKWGLPVSERRISIDELISAQESGKLDEAFGSGTAAVISPVGEIIYKDKHMTIGDGSVGELSHKFFKAITDIQYGVVKDTEGWVVPLD